MVEQHWSNHPPKADEIEITVIGPDTGFGECVLVHIGDGDWIVFDCCKNSKTGIPFPLEYLKSLYGCEPFEDKIKYVVLTHWDYDHVMGATELYLTSHDSTLCFSSLLQYAEINKVIAAGKQKRTSRFREIESLYKALNERRKSRSSADLRILKKQDVLIDRPEAGIKIDVISPSDDAIMHNHLRLVALQKESANQIIDESVLIEEISPNDCSVAVVIRLKNEQIILGADLEFHDNMRMGWQDVINSKLIGAYPVNIYKVAHHGSDTAYSPDMWSQLNIQNGCFSVLTPWRLAGRCLPDIQMVETILQHTEEAYITCNPYNISDDDLLGTGKNISLAITECGVVTLRKTILGDDAWRIHRFGSTVKLSELKSS